MTNESTAAMSPTPFQIQGTIRSRFTVDVGGLRVEIVDKSIGSELSLAQVPTDRRGKYQATFSDADLQARGKSRPDLQAKVFAGKALLGVSAVRYNASRRETLDVVLSAEASSRLPSEHETLLAAISDHFQGNLVELQETDDRQDITYLAHKTGWDARAVAFAALAAQFAASAAGIEPAFFYALFRAGLPTDWTRLCQTRSTTAETVWNKAIAQAVIPAALRKGIPGAVDRFRKRTAQELLKAPARIGVSSLKELLTVSLGEDANRHRQVATLYARHRGNPSAFWEAIRHELGDGTERRLKLDGQLASLTLNNAPLVRKLHQASTHGALTSMRDLIEMGGHRADTWLSLMSDDPVPAHITETKEVNRRQRYADLMAATVRLRFPTGVVAHMVGSGETPMPSSDATKAVHEFLSQHQDNFRIGREPVAAYVRRNNLQVDDRVLTEVTRIQRVYQITPTPDAMNALLRRGIDSAYAAVRDGRETFVRRFASEVGGEETARLIFAKAQQVHNATLNIAMSYLNARNAPGIGGHSEAQILDPHPHASDVLASTTLERLFGQMDFCKCEHCRSMLSPAAYLVDLLLFCDRPEPLERENPWEVLRSRRPDIEHLPLTCANTHTPLPYIDLVNETLEHYVANQLQLTNYEGHTTDPEVRPEELLANPQFVSSEAYQILAGGPLPGGQQTPLLPPVPTLPFHQPLEQLRRCVQKFEAPLPRLMEAFRANDDVERPNPIDPHRPVEYGWRDILMEELRFSRAEYRLLTDRTLSIRQLYGYAPGGQGAPQVPDELRRARTFCRRLGITYEELVDVLKTRFINPHATLIPKLARLGVTFQDLQALKQAPGNTGDAAFDEKLAGQIDVAQYGGDVKAWVKDQANYDKFMRLMILRDPTHPTDDCNFETLELRYANPDDNANHVADFEFVRLIRFIRLWKKLGWTIEQTDQAIAALYPVDQIPDQQDDAVNRERLDAGFLKLLPRLGVVARALELLRSTPATDLVPLLACFAPIDTQGAAPLYRQMFLGSAIGQPHGADGQNPWPFADDGYGNYLNGPDALLSHSESLRAAFHLTDGEFTEIVRALGFDNNTPLRYAPTDEWLSSVLGHPPTDAERRALSEYYRAEGISAVFRRGWLARKLALSVHELIALVELTGINPFAAPDPADPPILRLINLVNRLRDAGLKPDQALYLIWGRDLSGASAPAVNDVNGFARSLRADLLGIERDVALGEDPDGATARARTALHALQAIASATTASVELATAVLDNAAVLHSQSNAARPALDDLVAVQTLGIAAEFFFRATLPGPDVAPDERTAAATLSYGPGLSALPGQGQAISARWMGHVEAPAAAEYSLRVETDATRTALTFDGSPVEWHHDGGVWTSVSGIALEAGTFHSFTLEIEGVTRNLTVRWRLGEGPWELIPPASLFNSTHLDWLQQHFVRFLQTASLAAALELTAKEIAFLASQIRYQIGGRGWLNSLPVDVTPALNTANALLTALNALVDFRRLKSDLSPDDERLVVLLEDPDALAENGESLLSAVAHWQPEALDSLLARFGANGGRQALADVDLFGRVHRALTFATALGMNASTLASLVTNEPDATTVRKVQAALRTRYDQRDWLAVLRPINDEMRALQRDALVAYILHQMWLDPETAHIDTGDKLFEYFLMDVQMDPCMQTSRIRHALSSVQLFIERCLMNLETRVAPSSINARRWEWMSRYRVWEANRKVFLWPENWLEPELRDDQSPFFKEAMSELLQSDITEDSAAIAYLNYLSKLQVVAKLEPCGLCSTGADDQTQVVHVVARVPGARKYFYRARDGSTWTPWDAINLDIDGNPVVPVVWKNRLWLFWLKILQEGPVDPEATSSASANTDAENADYPLGGLGFSSVKDLARAEAKRTSKVTVRAVLCWSEYYNGKWQPTKTSDVNKPTTIKRYRVSGRHAFNRDRLRLIAAEENDRLRVSIGSDTSFLFYNSYSLPVRREDETTDDDIESTFSTPPNRAFRVVFTRGKTVAASYYPGRDFDLTFDRPMLMNQMADQVVEIPESEWLAPFFYQDSRHVFFVTTTEGFEPELDVYGLAPGSRDAATDIPSLVLRDGLDPETGGRDVTGIEGPDDAGQLDPRSMREFVSEDGAIDVAIEFTRSVRFGDAHIGPVGRIGGRN